MKGTRDTQLKGKRKKHFITPAPKKRSLLEKKEMDFNLWQTLQIPPARWTKITQNRTLSEDRALALTLESDRAWFYGSEVCKKPLEIKHVCDAQTWCEVGESLRQKIQEAILASRNEFLWERDGTTYKIDLKLNTQMNTFTGTIRCLKVKSYQREACSKDILKQVPAIFTRQDAAILNRWWNKMKRNLDSTIAPVRCHKLPSSSKIWK